MCIRVCGAVHTCVELCRHVGVCTRVGIPRGCPFTSRPIRGSPSEAPTPGAALVVKDRLGRGNSPCRAPAPPSQGPPRRFPARLAVPGVPVPVPVTLAAGGPAQRREPGRAGPRSRCRPLRGAAPTAPAAPELSCGRPPPSPPPPRAGTARVRGATVSAGHPGTGTACGAARWGRGWGGFGPFPPALRCSPRPAAPELPPQCPALQHCTAPGPPRGGGRKGLHGTGVCPLPSATHRPPPSSERRWGSGPAGGIWGTGGSQPPGGGKGTQCGAVPRERDAGQPGGGRAAAHSRAISSVSRCAINNSRDPSRSACHEIFIPAVTERVKRSSALHSLGVPAGRSALTPQRCQNGRWAHCDWGRGGCGGSCRWGPALVGMGSQM